MIDYLLNVGFTFVNMAFLPVLAFAIVTYFYKASIASKKLALKNDKDFDMRLAELEERETVRKGYFTKFFGLILLLILLLSAVSPSNTPKRTSTEVDKHHKEMVATIKAEAEEKVRKAEEKPLESKLRPNKLTDEESQKRFEELTKVKKDQE